MMDLRRRHVWKYRRLLLIILTPLCVLPLPLVIRTKVAGCGYTLVLMAVFWMSEILPLSVTALLPALLFPLFGILKSSEVASMYFKDFHVLLMGVICLATSIEKWGLHRRIALRLVTFVGANPGWLMLGFMAGCAFLSMWLSNTSTVAMVMPIVEAVIQQIVSAEGEAEASQQQSNTNNAGNTNPSFQLDEVETQYDKVKEIISAEIDLKNVPSSRSDKRYRTQKDHMMCKGLSLCIAYSSSFGGLSTLTGTAPNLIFSEYIRQFYPECTSINFGNWFIMCLPISIIVLVLSWIWLHWMFLGSNFSSLLRTSRNRQSERERLAANVIQQQYDALGPMSSQEIVSLIIFVLMALLWFFREPGFMPGWSSLFSDYPGFATDATVAVLLGILLFIIPSGRVNGTHYEPMITWKEFQSCMPWEISLLVGGGFALAEGTEVSGLSEYVANLLTPLGDLPPLATVTIACLIVTSVTEVASNPATATIFLPILAPLAEAIKINPLYMLIPAVLSVSFAFVLPVSNPSNAIVFTYGHLTTMDMVKAGLGVNVIGILAVLLALTTWGTALFDLDTYPEWAPGHGAANITGAQLYIRVSTMLDPSSSEESGGELPPDDEPPIKPGKIPQKVPKSEKPAGAPRTQTSDPSPAVPGEDKDDQERLKKEEAERKIKLQIYVFVLRCIAYPFNAKQPTDMARRQQKMNKQQLQAVKERFNAFLRGETQIVADEAFCNAVRSYYEGAGQVGTL
ncbi:solute carrier family 13 member 1 [Chanos chanos]|uniref:Solute carrier family 13 member 1 n=1 Tax=Chanos chanos TaxID=29144 RepID=A0A6J2UPK4_CHACN|nr:solute carrier family 13 member 1-like [Chanos chanos]